MPNKKASFAKDKGDEDLLFEGDNTTLLLSDMLAPEFMRDPALFSKPIPSKR
jgi:hypothetical protein